MKKLFLAVLLSASALSFAQDKQDRKEKLTIEQQTELLVKKMTLELDLSSKQQQEIKTLLLEEEKKRESNQTQMKPSGEKPSADQRFERKNKMLDRKIEFKNKMKKILTSDQMEKWEETKENRPKRASKKERKNKLNE